jgi:O-antigen/teichoic acid export membrane protein
MKQYISLILDKSSSFLGLDVRYFGKNFTWLNGSYLISTGFGFILSIAFANLISKDIFGHYTYVHSLMGTMGFLGLTGMSTAISRAAANKRYSILPQAIATTLLTSIAGTILLAVLALGFSDKALIPAIIVAALVFPFRQISTYAYSFLHGIKEFKRASILSIFPAALSPILLIIALLIEKTSLSLLITLSLLPTTVLGILYTIPIIRKFNIKVDKHLSSKDVIYGLWLSIVDILPAAAIHIDKVIIGILLPPSHLAVYTFALALPNVARDILRNSNHLFLPKLSTISPSQYRKRIWRFLGLFSLLVVGSVLALIVIIPFVFRWFFPSYMESIRLAQLVSLSLLSIPSILFTTYFDAKADLKSTVTLNIVYFIFLVGSLFLFMKFLGLGVLGAVYAKISTRLLTGITSSLIYFTKYKN